MTNDVQNLGHAVKRLQYRHHRALDTSLAEVGTTLAQWDALRAIDRTPDASAHALAEATFQSDQAFGTLAQRLVAQGLVERRPGQGRRIEHRLTRAGIKTLMAGQPLVQAVLEGSFAALTATEKKTLLRLLAAVLVK